MNATDSFLGTGWAFPPSFDKTSRTAEMVSDDKDIKQSLKILLSTSIGERVMQPLYGCNLLDYQSEPINTYFGFLTDLVGRAILFYEPRIVVEQIEPTLVREAEGEVEISINYYIPATNTRSNFVFPFYLVEADRPV